MDEQWLREWASWDAEHPPKNLREQVGQLLDVHSISRQVYDQLRRGRWDEIGVDVDLVDALGAALAADDPTRARVADTENEET